VLFLCGDHLDAKQIVSRLVEDAGFVPVDLGGLAVARVMEAPRRPGAVYGDEYREPEACAVGGGRALRLADPPDARLRRRVSGPCGRLAISPGAPRQLRQTP
jgi:hypothetical protein